VTYFVNILGWSKEFGVDSQYGRVIKRGVVGIFAGRAFDLKEKVHVKDEVIDFASYAARLNLQLLRGADFNAKLRERGCKATVERISKLAANEVEIREALDRI
jgi:hypothetical protein